MTPISDATLLELLEQAEYESSVHPDPRHWKQQASILRELQQARELARKVRTHLCPHFDGSDCPYILARQIGGAQ